MQEPTTVDKPSLTEAITHSFNKILQGDVSDYSSLINKIVVPASVGLLSLLAIYFISKLVARRVSSVICRRVDETLGKFIGKMIFYTMMITATVGILSYFKLPVSGFMAVLATAGFAIGLAFQGTLSNFSAGILLLVFRPFKVGDTVTVASVLGKVNEIDIFTTTLDTPDNRRLIIPNATIAGGTIENMSYHPHRRIEVIVGVEYGASLEKTRTALNEAVQAVTELVISGEGRGHQILLSNLGTSSVDWTVRVWVTKENVFVAKEQLTTQIKLSLTQHQITIPFPQLHLHMAPAAVAPEESSFTRPSAPPSLTIPTIHTAAGNKVRPRARDARHEESGMS